MTGQTVVEFIGLPGSGKSTIAAEFARRNPSVSLFANHADFKLLSALRCPHVMRAARAIMAQPGATLRSVVGICAEMAEIAKWESSDHARLLMLDEGIIHSLASLTYTGKQYSCDNARSAFDLATLAHSPHHLIIVFVNTPVNVCVSRVEARPANCKQRSAMDSMALYSNAFYKRLTASPVNDLIYLDGACDVERCVQSLERRLVT